jgi:hypothetical protein
MECQVSAQESSRVVLLRVESRFAARSVPATQASSTRVCWTWTYRIVVAIQECPKTS